MKRKYLVAALILGIAAIILYLYKPIVGTVSRDRAMEISSEEGAHIIYVYPEKTNSYYYYMLNDGDQIPVELRGIALSSWFDSIFYTIDEPVNSFLVYGELSEKTDSIRCGYCLIDVKEREWKMIAPIYRDTDNGKFYNALLPKTYICRLDVLLGNYRTDGDQYY